VAFNLLTTLTPENPAPFQWENPSSFTNLTGGGIRIKALPATDFFRDPGGSPPADSAAYLYVPVKGDFVARAWAGHPFRTTWDAAALMVRTDPFHWGKLCFEGSDFGTRAVVSVVTNGFSDDANGVNLPWAVVWLQIVRKGNVFCAHYGPDGEHWNMVRYFALGAVETVKIGMVAQSPVGSGSEMDFMHFSLEQRTVKDIRAGI
jgi:uncharacterized protein